MFGYSPNLLYLGLGCYFCFEYHSYVPHPWTLRTQSTHSRYLSVSGSIFPCPGTREVVRDSGSGSEICTRLEGGGRGTMRVQGTLVPHVKS